MNLTCRSFRCMLVESSEIMEMEMSVIIPKCRGSLSELSKYVMFLYGKHSGKMLPFWIFVKH